MFQLKHEAIDRDGRIIGPLYRNGEPYFVSGKWVNLSEAQLIVEAQNEHLEII